MTDFNTILETSMADGSCLLVVLGKRRSDSSDEDIQDEDIQKVTVRPVSLRGETQYQLTSRRMGGQEVHENLDRTAAVARINELFGKSFRHCHLYSSEADYEARLKSDGSLKVKKRRPTKRANVISQAHDREKQYLIPEGVPCPFLVEMGVMTPQGKVKQSRTQKFRQVNRFLELVDDVVDDLPKDRTLEIVDFGCGKSYLTFALFHLLSSVRNRDVHIVGLDRNGDVVRNCIEVAERLGLQGIEFRTGDIATYQPLTEVQMAVCLHACDTATDDALAKAVEWKTDVILAVPCCQHELAEKLHNRRTELLEQHGILKERFAAIATDALRAKAMEISGYRTQVVEFIEMEHTAKNVLIRAVKRKSNLPGLAERIESYQNFKELLGIQQIYLERALGPEFCTLF